MSDGDSQDKVAELARRAEQFAQAMNFFGALAAPAGIDAVRRFNEGIEFSALLNLWCARLLDGSAFLLKGYASGSNPIPVIRAEVEALQGRLTAGAPSDDELRTLAERIVAPLRTPRP